MHLISIQAALKLFIQLCVQLV